MHTVLVADHDRSFGHALADRLNSEGNCRVVAVVYDGKSAIVEIERQRPEIIIIDFILPEADGLYVAEHVRRSMVAYNPVIYVLSCIGNETVLDSLNALDVDFFNMKPVSFEVILHNLHVIENMRQNAENLVPFPQRDQLREQVMETVVRFGVLPHRLSTKCIVDALIYYMENADDIQVLTKTVYPEIAKKHNITSYAVEKNIRAGIEIMQRGKTPFFSEVFAYAEGKRVTNGEFLAMTASYLCKPQPVGKAH